MHTGAAAVQSHITQRANLVLTLGACANLLALSNDVSEPRPKCSVCTCRQQPARETFGPCRPFAQATARQYWANGTPIPSPISHCCVDGYPISSPIHHCCVNGHPSYRPSDHGCRVALPHLPTRKAAGMPSDQLCWMVARLTEQTLQQHTHAPSTNVVCARALQQSMHIASRQCSCRFYSSYTQTAQLYITHMCA
jgi:hypothetical protein